MIPKETRRCGGGSRNNHAKDAASLPRLSFERVKHAAHGRWLAIWADHGITDLPTPGRHGPCPGCGGRDRFRLVPADQDDGGWICGQGGETTGGDGFSLLVHCGLAANPGEALRLVAGWLRLLDENPRAITSDSALRPPGPVVDGLQPESPKTDYARRIWLEAADDAPVWEHHYTIQKRLLKPGWSAGARRGTVSGRVVGRYADCIVVPVRDLATFEVVAAQAINPQGKKQTFGPVKGHAFAIGAAPSPGKHIDPLIPVFVVEGWADAVAMFIDQGGKACVLAGMGLNNLQAVAKAAADAWQPTKITIVEDAL